MSIDHDEALLNDLLDGRLAPVEAEALRARLDAEPALRELYAQLQAVGRAVRAWDPASALDAPRALREGVHDRVRGGGAGATPVADVADVVPRPRGRMLRMMTYAYAAAAVVVLGVTLAVTLGQREPPPPAHDLADEQAPAPAERPEPARRIEKPSGGGGVLDDAPPARESLRMDDAEPEKRKKAPGHFGPSGAVPPGLREPSDVPTPKGAIPAGPRAVPRGGAKGAVGAADAPDGAANAARDAEEAELVALAEAAEAVTYVLEVDDLAAARANLQLLLAEVERGDAKPTGTWRAKAARLVDALAADGARFHRASRDAPSAAPAPPAPSAPTTPDAPSTDKAEAEQPAAPQRQVVMRLLSAEAAEALEALTRDARLASGLARRQRHEGQRAPRKAEAPAGDAGDAAKSDRPEGQGDRDGKRPEEAPRPGPVRVRIVLVQR